MTICGLHSQPELCKTVLCLSTSVGAAASGYFTCTEVILVLDVFKMSNTDLVRHMTIRDLYNIFI